VAAGDQHQVLAHELEALGGGGVRRAAQGIEEHGSASIERFPLDRDAGARARRWSGGRPVLSCAAPMQRRDFLKGSLAAGAALAMPACSGGGRTAAGPTAPRPDTARFSDPSLVELADLALQAAREAGASYADIRIADYRRQTVATREARVLSIRDSEDRGFGVRVIAGGTWGFAASARVTREEVVAVARRAVAIARANSALQR